MTYFDDVQVGLPAVTPGEYVFEEDEIIAFAQQWDPQPFHTDPEFARNTPIGVVTASACHILCATAWLMRFDETLAVIAGLRHELDLLQPAKAGDRVAKHATCIEKRPSKSKPDRGIVVYETLLRTSEGADVARLRSTLLLARRPSN